MSRQAVSTVEHRLWRNRLENGSTNRLGTTSIVGFGPQGDSPLPTSKPEIKTDCLPVSKTSGCSTDGPKASVSAIFDQIRYGRPEVIERASRSNSTTGNRIKTWFRPS